MISPEGSELRKQIVALLEEVCLPPRLLPLAICTQTQTCLRPSLFGWPHYRQLCCISLRGRRVHRKKDTASG